MRRIVFAPSFSREADDIAAYIDEQFGENASDAFIATLPHGLHSDRELSRCRQISTTTTRPTSLASPSNTTGFSMKLTTIRSDSSISSRAAATELLFYFERTLIRRPVTCAMFLLSPRAACTGASPTAFCREWLNRATFNVSHNIYLRPLPVDRASHQPVKRPQLQRMDFRISCCAVRYPHIDRTIYHDPFRHCSNERTARMLCVRFVSP